MNTQHIKSPCCHATYIKYGPRRYQCSRCRKTWRIRKRKRGRRSMRVSKALALKLLETHSTIRQRSYLKQLSERQYQRRMSMALGSLNHGELYDRIPKHTPLTLLIDGLWAHCDGKRTVIYLLAVKPIEENKAYLLPPEVFPGAETHKKWQMILEKLPPDVFNRIVALICDGLSGMTEKASRWGWVVQRCQFHYIKTLERFRGKKNRFITEKIYRENLYRMIRKALAVSEEKKASSLFQMIECAASEERCPKWMRIYVKELLRYQKEFRACFLHPQLHLPATNGTMESLAGIVRARLYLSRGFRTRRSLKRWVVGTVYAKKEICCNGIRQPNFGR